MQSKYLAEHWFEDGGWYVVFNEYYEMYELFEVPLYGGEPRIWGRFANLEDAVSFARENWT